jgi:hypothetical protein
MALNSSVFVCKNNNPQDYDTTCDVGTRHLYTWKYTT